MNSIEEKKRPQKCQRGTLKQRQGGPRHPKSGQKKKKPIVPPMIYIQPPSKKVLSKVKPVSKFEMNGSRPARGY